MQGRTGVRHVKSSRSTPIGEGESDVRTVARGCRIDAV